MSFITANLKQVISHWSKSGSRDTYGNPTWDTPVLILGRWEDRTEKITLPTGEEYISRSIVFLDTDVAIGDYIFQGEFGSGDTDPHNVTDAFEVKDFNKVPRLRSSEYERTARL